MRDSRILCARAAPSADWSGMAPRPYLNHSGRELTELFQSCDGEVKALKALRAELVHRNTPSMRDLRARVDEALAEVKDATVKPRKAAAGGHPEQAELVL